MRKIKNVYCPDHLNAIHDFNSEINKVLSEEWQHTVDSFLSKYLSCYRVALINGIENPEIIEIDGRYTKTSKTEKWKPSAKFFNEYVKVVK